MIADEKSRILFVSDERMMRDALLAMFSGCADMDIIGAYDDVTVGPNSDSPVQESAEESSPDVIVVSMAGTHTGTAMAVRRTLDRWPQAKVVVLSPFFNKAFAAEILRAGAHGYVTTQSAAHELLEAVHTVTSGLPYLCCSIRQSVLEGFTQGQADKIGSDCAVITDREGTILQLFGEGRSSKEIATAMNLSSKTIDACRRQLMRKLDVDSMAGLVKCAIALGLTTVDPWPAPTR